MCVLLKLPLLLSVHCYIAYVVGKIEEKREKEEII
jgi:hypothetical protein